MEAALDKLHTDEQCIDWRNPRLRCTILGEGGVERVQWVYRATDGQEGRQRWRTVQQEIQDCMESSGQGQINCMVLTTGYVDFGENEQCF